MSSTQETIESTLVDKRNQWLDVLYGKDQNSIINQLTNMTLTWNAASFPVINEARLLAPEDPEGDVQLHWQIEWQLRGGHQISN